MGEAKRRDEMSMKREVIRMMDTLRSDDRVHAAILVVLADDGMSMEYTCDNNDAALLLVAISAMSHQHIVQEVVSGGTSSTRDG